MQVDVLTSVTQVPREEWDALAATAGFYSSHSWLTGLERDTRFPATHVVVRDDDGLAGAVTVYRTVGETNPWYRAPRLAVASDPDVVVGTRRGYRSGVLVREGAGAARVLERLRDALPAALDGADRPTFCYVPDDLLADVCRVVPGWHVTPVNTEAWLRCGDGFDAFTARLPKKRRTMLRHERRRFRASGYEVGCEPLPAVRTELPPLLRALEARHDADRGLAHYEGLTRALAQDADPGRVLTCRADGELVGFLHFYEFGDVVWARMAGFRYERLRGAFEYFNLAFYELLDVAARRSARAVHLGTGSLEAKLHHGAVAETLHTVARQGPRT